jgi:uncharacterized protein
MNIMITGGTGLIGQALSRSLLSDGNHVWVLTRGKPEDMPVTPGLTWVHWDGRTTDGWGGLVSQMQAIVNLAGASLAHWPWSKRRKHILVQSRINAGRAITEAIQQASPPPQVLLQVSGINHYGLRGQVADEDTPPGDDFLARLTVDWEQATLPVEQSGVRRCVLRLAVVLDKKDGLFPLVALPVRLFVGGRLGSGKQIFPWVHLEDLVGVMRYLLAHENCKGAYNLIAPEVVDIDHFIRKLAITSRRPFWFHVPAFLIRLLLGEMSVLLLEGRGAIPSRLLAEGYQFKFEDSEAVVKVLA